MTFQTSVGFDGPMYEDGWAKLAAMIGQRFSVGGPTDWQVAQVTGTRQVSVAAGAGFATGIRSSTAGATLLTVPQPTFGRWDLLVCRRNWNPNTANGETSASFVLIPGATTGTTSAAAVPTSAPTSYPAGYNDTPGTLVDQPLAWVWTRNSDTTTAVFDLRTQPLPALIGAIQAYARREGTPFAMAAGKTTGKITQPGTPQSVVVVFPAGRFTVPPVVTATSGRTDSGVDPVGAITVPEISATQMTLKYFVPGPAAQIVAAHWTAVQMTPTSAAG